MSAVQGEYAEYVVPLKGVFKAPKGKRARRAITAIKRFVWKHARSRNVKVTKDVNEKIWENAGRIPRRIEVVLFKDKDTVVVYLKGSKQIDEDRKKRTAAKKKKEQKRKKKEAEKKEEKAVDEEQQKKLEEKREKEKAMAALEKKMG